MIVAGLLVHQLWKFKLCTSLYWNILYFGNTQGVLQFRRVDIQLGCLSSQTKLGTGKRAKTVTEIEYWSVSMGNWSFCVVVVWIILQIWFWKVENRDHKFNESRIFKYKYLRKGLCYVSFTIAIVDKIMPVLGQKMGYAENICKIPVNQ